MSGDDCKSPLHLFEHRQGSFERKLGMRLFHFLYQAAA
jgi:hypothetical protein